MDPVPKQTIAHFTHPGHQLEQVYAETEYTCDGCKTQGHGLRYECSSKSCYYVLHDYCGTCPPSLSSFMHPQHPLTLVVALKNDRRCAVCREPVEGRFYWCKDCDFDVHPICTQLPPQLRHALDQSHPLIFEAPVFPSTCSVCRAACACSSWRYRCGVCGLDIHPECILAPCVPPTQQRSVQPSGPNPNPPPPYPPPPPSPCGGYGYGIPSGYGYGDPSGYGYGVPSGYGAPSGYGYEVPSGYGYGCGYGVPSGYDYGVPSGYSDNHNMYNNGNQARGHCEPLKKVGKWMFSVVQQLAIGVASNVIFGLVLAI